MSHFEKDESLDTSFGRQSNEAHPRSPSQQPLAERRRSVSSAVSSPQSKSDSGGDHVKVVCRVRPFNRREADIQEENNAKLPEYERQPMRSVIEMNNNATQFLDHHNNFQLKESFPFDENMWSIPVDMQESDTPFAGQEVLMERVGKVAINNAMNGFNSCILAYGQTGSGKTYSMTGTESDIGLIPRCCEELFDRINAEQSKSAGQETFVEFRVELQFLEIYNDQVKDLLAELAAEGSPESANSRKHSDKIQLRQSAAGVSQVVGATSITVSSWADCARLLDIGGLNRAFATTKMNDASSRSHAIVRLTVTRTLTVKPHPSRPFERPKTFDRVSLINLVDLAGSERQKKSGAEGQQLVEASHINFSLSVLMRVIDALVNRTKPPYRECQLTWFLMESLGGNSKTFVIACVSPHTDNSDETYNTLRWALRTQGIVNEARVNESDEARRIMELQQKVEDAKKALQENNPETSERADLLRDAEERKSAISELLEQRSKQEQTERDLAANVLEEKKKTYQLRYANSFRSILFGRMADKLAEIHESLARQKSVMDVDQSTEKGELDRAETELNILRQEEALLTQQVERLRRDHTEAEVRYHETSEEVRRMDRNASLNEAKLRAATIRGTCSRIMMHVAVRASSKRLQRKLDELAKQQAREKLDATKRGTEARALAQSNNQRSIDRVDENISNFTQRIAVVEAQIKATNEDRQARLRDFSSKITFLEHENRNINDARLKMRAQLDREESQHYDKRSTELSEENVRKCQVAEQVHKAILLEMARQKRLAMSECESQIAASTERISEQIAQLEAQSDAALAEQASSYSATVAKHDSQLEDASTFLNNWRHKHRGYASAQDEIMTMMAQLSTTKDPELRAMLTILNEGAPQRAHGPSANASTSSAFNAQPAFVAKGTPAGSPNTSGSQYPRSPTGYVGRSSSKLGSRKAPSNERDGSEPNTSVSGSIPRMVLGARRK